MLKILIMHSTDVVDFSRKVSIMEKSYNYLGASMILISKYTMASNHNFYGRSMY